MQNLLDPAILFFVFGVLAGLVKSNLEIPPQISRFLALYLLMALGLKGGFALAESGMTTEVASSLACAVAMALVVPTIGYQVLKRFVAPFDALAVAATYGSVSAVTFITAVQYLETHGLAFGGHMAAAMALMESPAIIMVTHHVEEIPVGFTHVLLLSGGRVVSAGLLAEALTAETLTEAFGLPIELRETDGRFTARAA